MTAAADKDDAKRKVRRTALAIAWLWAIGWVVLGAMFGSGGLEGGEAVVGAIIQGLVPGAIFIAVAILAMRSTLWGALALFACAIVVGAGYPMWASEQGVGAILLVEFGMAAPAFIAGALLLLGKARVGPSPDAAPPAGDLP